MEISLNDGLSKNPSPIKNKSSEEDKKQIRFSQVGRNKNYVHMEMINGKKHIIEGVELHTRVFSREEQKNIVEYVYNLQSEGPKGILKGN